MHTGDCIFFNSELGYGFLRRDDGGADLFCHFTALQMSGYKTLKKGDRVQFEIEVGPKEKPQAANVTKLST